jgi:HEAT repeat protein
MNKREEAKKSLIKLLSESDNEVLIKDLFSSLRDVAGEDLTTSLLTIINNSKNIFVRTKAIEILNELLLLNLIDQELHLTIVESLISLITQKEPLSIRQNIAFYLGWSKNIPAKYIKALIQILQTDDDTEVLRWITSAFSSYVKHDHEEALKMLTASLEDLKDIDRMYWYSFAFGYVGEPKKGLQLLQEMVQRGEQEETAVLWFKHVFLGIK